MCFSVREYKLYLTQNSSDRWFTCQEPEGDPRPSGKADNCSRFPGEFGSPVALSPPKAAQSCSHILLLFLPLFLLLILVSEYLIFCILIFFFLSGKSWQTLATTSGKTELVSASSGK